MAVARINKSKNFTVMGNYHLRDKNLSYKAKGLLSLMLSLPDDWNYTIEGLSSISIENETAIKNTLKELKDNGYLIVTKKLPNETKSGRIEYVYDIFEQKQDIEKQGLENLGVDFLGVENQGQLNNNIYNTKELNTNNITKTTIYTYLEENFGRTISSSEIQKLDDWLLLFNEEIIKHSIDLACLNNKKTMMYVNGILKNWKSCGYKTLQEILDNEENINNKPTKPKYRNDGYKGEKINLDNFSDKDIEELIGYGYIDENGVIL